MFREITPSIEGLQLAGYPAPIVVPVRPQPNCPPNQCWLNVPPLVEQHGGSLVSGRIVWTESKGKWLHLEAHCNWRMADGTIIDPTPKVDGEKQIVFVEEPLTFDGYSISCRYLPLSDDPLVKRFSQIMQRISEILSTIPVGEERVAPPEFVRLLVEKSRLFPRIYPPVSNRNRSQERAKKKAERQRKKKARR